MLASATWSGTYVENVQVQLTFLARICNAEKKLRGFREGYLFGLCLISVNIRELNNANGNIYLAN